MSKKAEKVDLTCASCGRKGRSLGSMILDNRVADGDGKLRHAKCHRAKYGNAPDDPQADEGPKVVTFEPHQQKLYVLTIDMEKPRKFTTLRYLLEGMIQKKLEHKDHGLGEVRVHLREAGDVEAAAWCFAQAIKRSGEEAVEERLQ